MSIYSWHMELFDLGGNPIDVVPIEGGDNTNIIQNAMNRSLTYNLNGIDELDFDLLLTDPMAFEINRLKTVVKLWRTIDDEVNSKTLDSDNPSFGGLVTYTNKVGSSNTMNVKVSSPLWRLQTHFHILNHYLNINPDTTNPYTVSELMWKLIDLINEAFGDASDTGIAEGTFGWGFPDEPSVSPFFVSKGSNTWSNIFDTIMTATTTGVDIIPEYVHTNGDPTIMNFSTAEVRGTNKTGITAFNYHTEPTLVSNCDDMSDEEAPQPSTGNQDAGFANYVWVAAQGGPNSGKVAVAENSSATDGSNGVGELGVYMALVEQDSLRTYAQVSQQAPLELAVRTIPQSNFTVSVATGGNCYYDIDYTLGDFVPLNANKGALVVDDVGQRVVQSVISISENNLERVANTVTDDYTGKLAD